ncbi:MULTISPECIES: VOC family protein [Streptacidiphilus]|uniref:VOC family protein n=2 Tax=Streptacidiphilus TaxID=228398 RepID=A0ABV6UQG0_9ACTN|nr:VOC family protein [Streptacidiphilus jeojiense]
MPEVKAPYAPGTPCWVDLMVPDQQAALDFYRDILGWQGEPGAAETGGYAVCTYKGLPVAGIGPTMDESTPTVWTTYLATGDAEATAAAIGKAGGTIMMPPMDVMTLGRMMVAVDPAGAVFGVWQHKDFIGAQLVNEPGALAWNECNSRDAEASGAFYKTVFGLGVGPIPGAPEGPGGYLTIQVDGRPVGGINPMTDENFPEEVPSHWMTYFCVDDTDSTVDAAVKRGANVTSAPQDTPFGRMAALTDPWGASFSIIQDMPTG